MADDDQAIEAGLETAPQLQELPVEEPAALEPTGEEPAPGEGEVAEELKVFEHEGKTYQVPNEIFRHLMRDKDYTEGKQSQAAREKALEARERENEDRHKATDEELDARADLRAVNRRLEEYAKLGPQDWAAHEDKEPFETQRHWRTFQMLKDQKAALEATIADKGKARTEHTQRATVTRFQDARAYAEKNITGWGKDLSTNLFKYAEEIGIPENLIEAHMSPVLLTLLNDAYVGRKARTTPVPKTVTVPEVRPLTVVQGNGNAPARKPVAQMSVADHSEAIRKEKQAARG